MNACAVLPKSHIFLQVSKRSKRWVSFMYWDNCWLKSDSYNQTNKISTTNLEILNQIYDTKIIYYKSLEDMMQDRFDEFI